MSLKLPRHWDFSTFKTDTARIARSKSVMPVEGGNTPDSPRSPTAAEKPLKAGWLKKQQRSLVKNWQQRYVVLRGNTLTYHKDDKETTVQGVIQLRFCKVNELLSNPDDPGKYLFEIVPRSTGDRERCPYLFMANSQSDLEEWVRTLRRVIGAPTSGVFGKSLLDIVTHEKRFGPLMVPILVQKCVEFIKERGLDEEGIFRLPGQDNAVKQFRDAFDAGERPSFPSLSYSDTDVHTVASLLKLYLRELPEPVVPWSQYQDFLDCTNQLDSSNKDGWKKLEFQISLLPRINYNLLGYICRFLFEVQQHSQVNKMNVENLATVMGINLLKPQIEDPITVMKATPQIQKLMTVMIRQHESLFAPCTEASAPSNLTKTESQKNSPRSFVGWESAEMGDATLTESPEEEEDNDSPNEGDCSHQKEPFLHGEPLPPNDWSEGPRKRTQTLPTFSCPLTGIAAKAEALNRWSRIQESTDEKIGTFSEDIFKLLDLKSSGSFFTGSQQCIKKEEVKRGGDHRCLTLKDSSSTPPSPLAHQKSLQNLTVNNLSQEVNNKTEQKNQDQQDTESLQSENRTLKFTVAELQSALEAEQRRVTQLQISLKNAERARDEAQRRILELQGDIPLSLTREKRSPT